MSARSLLAVAVGCFLLVAAGQATADESHCTLGQQTYGNPSASFNGEPMGELLDGLITAGSPLLLGKPGRAVLFLEGSEPCIISALPAGGRPAALPETLGDASVDSTCQLPESLPATKKGKLRNALLGETIALSLNVRLDTGLSSVELEPIMMTVEALPGPDGLYGTPDDVACAECDTMTIRISDAVLDAVTDAAGAPADIGGLLALANTALAGGDTGEAGLRAVWKAVKNVNRLFKRCRIIETEDIYVPILLSPAPGADAGGSEDDRWGDAPALSLSVASPARDRARLHFSVREPSDISIALYSVSGRLVTLLHERTGAIGEQVVDVPLGPVAGLTSGVYFIRATAVPVSGGPGLAETGRVVILR